MEIEKFMDQIDNHNDLDGVCIEKLPTKSLVIRHISTGNTKKVPIDTIKETNWEDLESVLVGKREPNVLSHITRIVGYYSSIENWNPSKLSELDDRHKGDYEIK